MTQKASQTGAFVACASGPLQTGTRLVRVVHFGHVPSLDQWENVTGCGRHRLAGTAGKVNVLSPKTTCCVCFKDGMFYARMCFTKTTNAFCGENVQTEQHWSQSRVTDFVLIQYKWHWLNIAVHVCWPDFSIKLWFAHESWLRFCFFLFFWLEKQRIGGNVAALQIVLFSWAKAATSGRLVRSICCFGQDGVWIYRH